MKGGAYPRHDQTDMFSYDLHDFVELKTKFTVVYIFLLLYS